MSTAASSTSASRSAPSSTTSRVQVFKGKDVRSWSQLPSEVIRHVATHLLVTFTETAYTPNTWTIKDLWPSRLLYSALRDALELEKLMAVCTTWAQALEQHRFWHHACALIDPHDSLAHHAVIRSSPAGSIQTPSLRLPPYRHFRNITNCSCLVCRLNYPFTTHGLGTGKRVVYTPYLQTITTCRDHRKATYCSLCLRAAPLDDTHTMVCCAENEDEETWPNVEATCRCCRQEMLWRRVAASTIDREAFQVPPFKWKNIADWEVRQAVETFIDMGEGCISDVLCLAREKHWLRNNTKIADMLSQALAASRYVARAESGYDAGVDGSDDEISGDDEDDPELMSLTEDAGGIRELAISDWARNRILDGYWVSPADQWYGLVVPGQPPIPATHPCPWLGATYSGALVDGESTGDGEELDHPRPRTYKAPCPPTFQLCELVHRSYMRVMHEVLLPAMSNIVRRILMECSADHTDPAVRAAKMTIEDVVNELRDHAIWTKGIDWIELRASRLRDEQVRRRRTGSEEDDSSASSRSDGSHTTSPVLSTTTLQTTPSPPPCVKEDEAGESPTVASATPMATPTSPSLSAKELLRPIPYIPVSVSDLPQYSLEYVKSVWREACAPLYQCRCSICERAMLKVNMEGKAANDVQPLQVSPEIEVQRPVQIHIEDPAIIALREEEEEDDPDADLDDGESEKDEDIEEVDLQALQEQDENPFYVTDSPTEKELPTWETKPDKGVQGTPQRARKRSHEELPDDIFTLLGVQKKSADRATTPPKRQRLDGSYTPSVSPSKESLLPTPLRARKRSSEELEDEPTSTPQNGKRMKACATAEIASS